MFSVKQGTILVIYTLYILYTFMTSDLSTSGTCKINLNDYLEILDLSEVVHIDSIHIYCDHFARPTLGVVPYLFKYFPNFLQCFGGNNKGDTVCVSSVSGKV